MLLVPALFQRRPHAAVNEPKREGHECCGNRLVAPGVVANQHRSDLEDPCYTEVEAPPEHLWTVANLASRRS